MRRGQSRQLLQRAATGCRDEFNAATPLGQQSDAVSERPHLEDDTIYGAPARSYVHCVEKPSFARERI